MRSGDLDEIKYIDGAYRTSNAGAGFSLLRKFPSFNFYPRLLLNVFRSSRMAKGSGYDTAAWVKSSLEVLRALELAGIEFEVTGVDNIMALDGPCVYIANHMSSLETFVLPAIIGQFSDLTFVVKKGLVDYPVFRHIMRSRDPVTVGRLNPRDDLKAVLEGGTERLKAGRSIVIFPQTTRTSGFNAGQFNTIGIKLAKRAQVPVVPIALRTDAWGTGTLLKDFGRIDPRKKVRFAFGRPLWIKGRGAEEHDRIIEFISGKLQDWENK